MLILCFCYMFNVHSVFYAVFYAYCWSEENNDSTLHFNRMHVNNCVYTVTVPFCMFPFHTRFSMLYDMIMWVGYYSNFISNAFHRT